MLFFNDIISILATVLLEPARGAGLRGPDERGGKGH
jgi:hypothetical protein